MTSQMLRLWQGNATPHEIARRCGYKVSELPRWAMTQKDAPVVDLPKEAAPESVSLSPSQKTIMALLSASGVPVKTSTIAHFTALKRDNVKAGLYFLKSVDLIKRAPNGWVKA